MYRWQQLLPNELLTHIDRKILQEYNEWFWSKVTQRKKKYEIKEKIWLKVNKEASCREERSLNKTYKGSYKIMKKGPNQTYKLNILNSGIHDTFHECKLKTFYHRYFKDEDSRLKTTEAGDKKKMRQE